MINSKSKGFTLTELLVVIFIVISLSSRVLVYYRGGERQFSLQRSVSKLAQDIRKAQQMAMAQKACLECGGGVPTGYGVYLKEGDNFYLLYADNNGDEKYSGGDTQIEIYYFEKGIYIKSINPSPLSINFRPPDPKVRIGNGTEVNEILITLGHLNDQAKINKVRINKAGLIAVE